MPSVKIAHLTMKRRRLLPFVDISPFFLVFGITGMPGARKYRLDRRFDREYYSYLVTLKLSRSLTVGRYRLDGLPDEVNRRGWRAQPGARLSTDLSEEGWHDLQTWLGSRQARTIRPVWLGHAD